MTEYHKINALFMRDMSLPNKPLIPGAWASPEFGYLADNQWEFTEKVDGTNIRIWLETDENLRTTVRFGGRTDRASIPTELFAYLQDTFTPGLFADAGLTSVTLYGEGYGPKIQSGGNYREDQSFVLFDVKIGDFWLTRENVDDIAYKLGIDSVPTLGYGTLWDAIQMVRYGTRTVEGQIFNVNEDGAMDRLSSKWGDFEADGIVARPVVPLFNRQGNRIIAKIKARDFR